jgi:hypothetical protein
VLNRGNFRDALGYAAANKVLDTAGNLVGNVTNALNPFARQQGMSQMQGFTTHTAEAEAQIMLDAVGELEKIAVPVLAPALTSVGRALVPAAVNAVAGKAIGAATSSSGTKAPKQTASTPRPTA